MGHTAHLGERKNNLLQKFKMMLYLAVAAIFVGLANADIVPDVMIPDVCYQKKVGDTYTCFARTGKVCVTHFNSTDPCGQHAADCEVPCDEQEKSCLKDGEIVWLNQFRETDMTAEMLSSTPTLAAKLSLLPVEMVIVIHLVRRKFLNVDGWSWIAQKQ